MHDIVPTLIAPIARCSQWQPSVTPDGLLVPPNVQFIEPMLRRRLSSLARMTLAVAGDCAQGLDEVRFVFASRHGELGRTVALLEALADKEDLSPVLFGLSVLNASTGLFSILRKDRAPSSAISCGRSSFGYGLMESALQLAEHPDQSVLYVYADELVPELYGDVEPQSGCPHVVGLLLQSSADLRISLSCSATTDSPSEEAQARAFMRCIDGGESRWCGDGRIWSWTVQS